MNIAEALEDRKLLGASPAFADLSTWRPWQTFLRATYGLPLDDEGVELFKRCTGRSCYDPPPGGWPEVVNSTARQAGKTVAALEEHVTATGEKYAPHEQDGAEGSGSESHEASTQRARLLSPSNATAVAVTKPMIRMVSAPSPRHIVAYREGAR